MICQSSGRPSTIHRRVFGAGTVSIALGLLAVALPAVSASAATVTSPALVAEDTAPFEHVGDIRPPFYGVAGIVSIRAAHDPAGGRIDFELRTQHPLPERAGMNVAGDVPRRSFNLHLQAAGAGAAVYVALDKNDPRRPMSASYVFSDGQTARPTAYELSDDRRLLRVRLTDARLRGVRYAHLTAGMESSPFKNIGPGSAEKVSTVFDQPLETLTGRLRRGRLTVASAPGARVRVVVRRSGGTPTVIRYRQTALGDSATKLWHRFCPRRARYTITIRARDRYGNRRTAKLRTGRSPQCARRLRPLIAAATQPARERGYSGLDEVADIVAVRVVHDRERASMLLRMRLARPVPRRGTFELGFFATSATDDGNLEVRAKLTAGESSASYVIDRRGRDATRVTTRILLSRNRKSLAVQVNERALRDFSYSLLSIDTWWYPRGGDATHANHSDDFETPFDARHVAGLSPRGASCSVWASPAVAAMATERFCIEGPPPLRPSRFAATTRGGSRLRRHSYRRCQSTEAWGRPVRF